MQMGVSRYKLCERIDDGDDGFPKLLVFHTCGDPECAGPGHPAAFGAYSTSQLMLHNA
jgi:hypothetical protein